jgi:thiamine biosynthesis protein ThiI
MSPASLPVQILIRSPEITLKGRNQGEFWLRLKGNVEKHLAHRGISWPVKTARARLYLEAGTSPGPEELERALRAVGEVAGVDSYSAARRIDKSRFLREGELDRTLIEETLVEMARSCFEPERSFAIRVHRVDKRFPLASAEMEGWLGSVLRERTGWSRVRLDRPERTFYVDIYGEAMFLYADRFKGTGGLPVGSSGRVLSLLSGGIDSPVASYLLARRGAAVDWFHMSAAHLSEADFESSVVGRIARKLSLHTLQSRLFVVPYTHFDLALSGQETGYEAVLFRRFLFRAGESMARRVGAVALVTGDSLAQVASQTLENLVTSTKAIDTLVLRPLVGLDKQQIMEIARRIGTYETSIEPHKDCCALYGRRARTRTSSDALSAIEKRFLPDLDGLIRRSLEDASWGEYECGDLVAVHSSLGAGIEAGRI